MGCDGSAGVAGRERGLPEMFLDTATNQPEAMAFYQALGYREIGRETRPEWSWKLVYDVKPLSSPRLAAQAL